MILHLLILSLIVNTSPEDQIREGLLQGTLPRPASPTQLEDGAIGILDVGQLAAVTTNWGVLVPTPMDFMPALHWPRNAPDQHQYSFGNFVFVAQNGNVATIHNWLAEFTSDWSPVRVHSGNVTNPDGWPFLAASDDPRTWPNGQWPGPYRIDPQTGQEVPGEFTSDRDLYAVYNDRNNPLGPIGVEIHQLAYSYGRTYAEDILIYRLILFNTTADTLHDLYFGVKGYNLVDFDFEDLIFFKDANPWDEDTTRNFVYWVDADGTPQDPWVSNGPLGLAILRTPYNLGVTTFHWYKRTVDPMADSTLWPVIITDTTSPAINPEFYFHGGINPQIDRTPPDEPERYIALVATGPFDLPPGDSVELAIAYLAGTDTLDLFENAATVFKMEQFEFQGPKAPPPPHIVTLPGDGYVKIVWSRSPSETTPDPFTGEFDFEGYRIYRSSDFGQTWGDPITDATGAVVGYKPLAIFDLKDDIYGPDPVNPYFDRGNDTGLEYTFIDSSVLNGLTYWYMVTAYDKGDPENLLPAMESPFGVPSDPHVDSVIPGPPPRNWNPGQILGDTLLTPIQGISTAKVAVSVVDPAAVTGDTYQVVFDTLQDTLRFSVLALHRLDSLRLGPLPIPDTLPLYGLPIFDGLRLFLQNVLEGPSPPQWVVYQETPSTFIWFTADSGRGPTFYRGTGTFLIQVNYTDSVLAQAVKPHSFSEDYPYEPVDTTFRLPFQAYYVDFVTGDTIPVDRVYLMEFRFLFPGSPPAGLSPPGWDWVPGGAAWTPSDNYRFTMSDQIGLVKYEITGSDTLDSTVVFIRTENGPEDAIPPSEGDIIQVVLNRPLSPEVVYEFATQPPTETQGWDLSQIKVVPNPLVVVSGMEKREGEAVLMFTHLPTRCTIRIYNLAGEHIVTLHHTNGLSYEYWDLRNKHGLQVAYGLYVYVVEAPDGSTYTGKFAIIR